VGPRRRPDVAPGHRRVGRGSARTRS
jgi:hypothetical protein